MGGTPHRKNVYWEGGHRTYFVDKSNTWGGDTAQHRKMGGGHRTYFVDEGNKWGGDTAHQVIYSVGNINNMNMNNNNN